MQVATTTPQTSRGLHAIDPGFATGVLPSISSSWRPAPWEPPPENFFKRTEPLQSYSLCNILSDERTGLSFTVAAGPHQLSHFPLRVPRDSRPHFTVSGSRLPQPVGSGPCIYIPQEQGGLLIPFCRLLRLSGLRWRYSNWPQKSKSKLLYDWRLTANQYFLASNPLGPTTRDILSTELLR
jgi:hypothetical protein